MYSYDNGMTSAYKSTIEPVHTGMELDADEQKTGDLVRYHA